MELTCKLAGQCGAMTDRTAFRVAVPIEVGLDFPVFRNAVKGPPRAERVRRGHTYLC
jgi:hypothetical protein